MRAAVDSLSLVKVKVFSDTRGNLAAFELAKLIPFPTARIFWVFGVPVGQIRGAHAHKVCHQFLLCAVGRITVDLFDGTSERKVLLEPGTGIHVPPDIFCAERYEEENSVLLVCCDRPYDPNDYINSRQEFITALAAK